MKYSHKGMLDFQIKLPPGEKLRLVVIKSCNYFSVAFDPELTTAEKREVREVVLNYFEQEIP